MSLDFETPTELEKQREAYFSARAKPHMTIDECIRLNEEILQKYPVTAEELQRKFERLKAIPEFVL